MKKFRKIAALLALTLVVCMLFTGCEGAGKKIMSALSLDVSFDDPALVMVADLAGTKVKEEGLKTPDGYKYTVYTDGTACVTGYEGKETVLNVPAEIDGMPVIGLENKALFKNETITELNLPDSVKYIGNYAVMHSRKLEKVTFGEDLEHIGVSAFECAKDKPTTSNGSLKTIIFKKGPKTISTKAFYFCDKVTEIILPEGVETIGDWAFAKNFSATKIELPSTLKTISNHAFLKCASVKELKIPGSVKNVEMSAFYHCANLEKLTIEEGVETLSKGAFEECYKLNNVTLPESIRTLDNYVFYNCKSLKDVRFGSNISDFGNDIFANDGDITIHTAKDSTAIAYAQENEYKVVND